MDMRRIESARGPVMISCFVFIGSRELNGDISVPCSRLYYVFYLNRLRIMSRISPAPRPLGRKAVQRYNHFFTPTKFFSNFFIKKFQMGPTPLLYIRIENYDRAVPWQWVVYHLQFLTPLVKS